MKRTLAVLLALIPGSISLAQADIHVSPADQPANPLMTPWSRPQATYVVQNPGMPSYIGDDAVHAAPGFSNIIYMNRCKGGCQINPGNNNSLTNTSGIPQQPSTVAEFNAGDAVWNQLVQCVKETYAPFGVTIVDERPAAGTNYHMAVVAGRPQDVQMQNGVGGVSEFSCGYIPNGISFSFANIYGGDVNQMCWTVAQETAHSWGLDHKFDNRDPMTYLESGPAKKSFQNQSGSCGEFSARACQCGYSHSGGTGMNSFAEILAVFGSSTPSPPTVQIDSPKDGDTVEAGFQVRATITDETGVADAVAIIDGNKQLNSIGAAPFVWTSPATLSNGVHTIKVSAHDVSGTPAEATIHVTIGAKCTGNATGCKSNELCVDGRCVLGDGAGALGTDCTDNSNCSSGQCGTDGKSHYCVEQCDPSGDGCPDGYSCIKSGASGVCWPGSDGGCSATASTQRGSVAPVFAMIGLVGLAMLARRRRS